MNTNHTPGPWEVAGGEGKHGDLYIWMNRESIIPEHAIATVHGEILQGAQANAKLIAAAPDLLEALEYIKTYATKDIGENGMSAVMHLIEVGAANAIQKATGKE